MVLVIFPLSVTGLFASCQAISCLQINAEAQTGSSNLGCYNFPRMKPLESWKTSTSSSVNITWCNDKRGWLNNKFRSKLGLGKKTHKNIGCSIPFLMINPLQHRKKKGEMSHFRTQRGLEAVLYCTICLGPTRSAQKILMGNPRGPTPKK